MRKLQHRSTQEFMCKDIHIKGTFTEILEEFHQIVFEKKLKKYLKRKVIHELCASHYFTFGLETLSLQFLICMRTKARGEL